MHAIDDYTDNHIYEVTSTKNSKTSTNAQNGKTNKTIAQGDNLKINNHKYS